MSVFFCFALVFVLSPEVSCRRRCFYLLISIFFDYFVSVFPILSSTTIYLLNAKIKEESRLIVFVLKSLMPLRTHWHVRVRVCIIVCVCNSSKLVRKGHYFFFK